MVFPEKDNWPPLFLLQMTDTLPSSVDTSARSVRALEARGIANDAILNAAGISQAPSNDPLIRIPLTSVRQLLAASVELTNDPYFGLYAANFLHAANLHALGYAMTASEILRELCIPSDPLFPSAVGLLQT